MTDSTSYNIDAERLLTSARAWGDAFPQFASLVAVIEARLLARMPRDSTPEFQKQKRRQCRRP
jgi:hypothetical protein